MSRPMCHCHIFGSGGRGGRPPPGAVRSGSSEFDANPSGIVDTAKEQVCLGLGQIFVGCLAGPAPESIVVDDQDPTSCQARIEMGEFVLGGLVPARVEPQEL